MSKIFWVRVAWIVFFVLYLALGLYTLLRQVLVLPFPLSIFMDYNFYHQALERALAGGDMYQIREIGPAFLYPPPALLLVDLLNLIPDVLAQGALLAALDVLMLVTLVYWISRKYSLSLKRLALFLIVALPFAPFLVTLELGQINFLTQFGLGLLFVFAFTLPWLAGFGLALAVVTKMTPLFFLAYLLGTKNFKGLLWAAVSLAGFSLLAGLRYGFQAFLTYEEVFRGLAGVLPVGANGQALAAKLLVHGLGANPGLIQFTLMIYLVCMVGFATYQTFRGGPSEAAFIVTALAMLLSPNILWYHHYVFFLLPLFIWMAWQRAIRGVTLWCLAGMLLIQFDYFLLTGGLLIHIFGHVSIWAVIVQSARQGRQPVALQAAG